ncbi:hypothetical protein HYE67_002814 [Fusarium culmorum]|uniref:Uncharacterized protein n=1 Tax=Fusarium culmorum TaxID=5516 RepID=A0A7S8D268_FUSCU|nr:hypothetical protein HYE67_002814 [Fusarium culmorum]
MKDHAWELLPRPGGGYHPLSRKINEDKLWGTMLSRTFSEGYGNLETMTVLYRQARDLSVLQKKYKDQIKPTEELPFEYRDTLYRFPSSVAIARQDEDCSALGCEGFGQDGHHLLFLMEMLLKDQKYWARRSTLIDEIERLLRTSSEANGLICAHVYKVLSHLSVLSQCTKQMELYQPWARHYQTEVNQGKNQVGHDYTMDYQAAHDSTFEVVEILKTGQMPLNKLGRIANPSGGKFKYQHEKRRTKDTVNALRQAEANLDAVWAEVDKLAETKMNRLKDLALYHLLSRNLRRTPEWVEPEQTKKGQPSTNTDVSYLIRPVSNLFLGESEQATEKTVPSKKKAKAKTKGEPTKTENVETPPVEVPEPELSTSSQHSQSTHEP